METGVIVPLKSIEYRVYGDLIMTYPKPYSIYLRETIEFRGAGVSQNWAPVGNPEMLP